MIGTSRLFQRFLSLMGPKLMTTVIAVLSTPIIVRLLGPANYGNYAVLLSIYSLSMIPISSAITEGVQKFVAEEREESDWIERVLQFYFVFALMLALTGSALLVLITRLGYAEIVGEGFAFYFYVLAIYILVGQIRAFSSHTVLGFGLEHVQGPLNVVKKSTTVIVGIALVASGLSVFGMLLGHIVANGLVALVAGYVILRRISVRRLFSFPETVPYREFLSFNVLNVVLILLVMSLFHVDLIMVRSLVSDEVAGFYKGALSMAEYIWVVPMVLQRLLLHSSSTLWSEQQYEQITALASRITRYTTLLVVLLAVGLAALADRVMPLYYGDPFVLAIEPLYLLLPGTIGFAIARPMQAICQGSGQLKTLIMAVSVAAFLNIALNATLIPLYGMNGAAMATSVAYGSMFLLLVWAARRIGYNPLVDFRLGRIALTAVLSGIGIVFVERMIDNDIVALLVVPVVGLGMYAVLAILTGAIDKEEIIEILDQLPIPYEFAPDSPE